MKEAPNIPFITEMEDSLRTLEKSSPGWINALRTKGLNRFQQIGLPGKKDEEWKFTNIDPVFARSYGLPIHKPTDESAKVSPLYNENEINIVFLNGFFHPGLSNIQGLPKGVVISPGIDNLDKNQEFVNSLWNKYPLEQSSCFSALNTVFLNDGAMISLDKEVKCEKPIHIIYVTGADEENILTSPRTLIHLDSSSSAVIIESHISQGDDQVYFSNAVSDIFLNDNSRVCYAKIQAESRKAFHIGTTRVWQERNSYFDGFSLNVGSALARNNLDLTLNGEGVDTQLNGLYAIIEKQHVDNHTSVEHQQPNGISRQFYKGILTDESKAVFNGKVFVRSEAQQTNSYQINKNLLLGEKCRVNTKPQLEISADDVKCSHGATIGQLNEDEIFYLQTRGIDKNTAVKILAHGFVDDILNTICHQSVLDKCTHLLKPIFERIEK